MRSSRTLKLVAAALFTGVVASCDDPTRPTIEASLQPRIALIQPSAEQRASLVLPLTEVRVRTLGPTGRVVQLTLQGGVWTGTVTGLAAGDYEVLVEGIANGQVQFYGRLPNITIARGQRAQPTITFAAAVPVVNNPPLNNTTNFSQRIPFASIPSATSYTIEYSQDNNFVNGVTQFASADTNPLINVTQPGTWYIRSRAILPQVPATSVPWSETRSWIVVEANGGDDAADAQPVTLTPETPQTFGDRNITPTKREDWFEIDAEAGDSVFAETFAARLAFASSLNTTLTLFENDGATQVAQNLDAPGTNDSRLVYVAENSGTYKLRVGATSNTSGHYELETEIRRLPLPPENLAVQIVSGTSVNLTWQDRSANETSFRVERCEGVACDTFTEVASPAPGEESLAQSGLTQGSTYRWRVRARNNVGNSAYTNVGEAALVGPAAPSAVVATTQSNTSIQLVWSDNASNETGYEIQRCVAGGGCAFATIGTVGADVEVYLDATAAYNTSYQYQIRATNNVVPSAFTAPVDANTLPPATPSNLVASVTGPTTINLSWTDEANNETFYLIERCLGDACNGFAQIDSVAAGVSNYVSTVANNAGYRFRIRARNAVISQTYSSIVAADTRPPATPTGLAATTQSGTSIALLWTDAADDETGYLIERCSSGASCSDFTTVTTVAADIAGYTDNSVSVGNSYRYRVTAVGIPGNSAPSNIAAANTLLPAAPSALSATVIAADVMRLTWTDNADNETGYDLHRCAGASCSNLASILTFSSGVLTIDDSTTVPGVEYTYVLYASNVAGLSTASNTASANTLPPTVPAGAAAALISGGRVDLSWTNGSGNPTGTRVERCTGQTCNSGDFVEIAFVPSPDDVYQDFGIAAGNFYRYRLRAQNAADVSAFTSIIDVDARFMSAPTDLTAGVSDPSPEVTLSWTASVGPGLVGYEIERCDLEICVDADFVNVGGVGAGVTAFTESVGLGNNYRYRVRAVNTVGPGTYSAEAPVNTLAPSTPTGVAAELRTGVVRITWTDNSSNETQQFVERCEGAGCGVFSSIGSLPVNATSFDDNTVVAGTTYNYRVYAVNLLGSSPQSAVVAVTPFVPVAPNGLAVTTVNAGQIDLSWNDNSLNESGFEIRRCTGDGCSDFAAIDSVAAGVITFSDVTVAPGESYTYSVAAIAAFGNSNTSSEETATTRLPLAPTALAAMTLSNTSIRLNWTDNADNETQYVVRQCAGVGCTTLNQVASVAAGTVQYDVTGLSANETYSFDVYASNSVGNSAESNVATATTNLPAAPTPLTVVVNPNATSVQLQWTLVANATGYSIERCFGGGCTDFTEIVEVAEDGITNSYGDTGLTGGETYRYRIAAVNAAGSSEFSPIETRTLAVPVAPSGLNVSVEPGFYAQLNWSDNSNNETGFEIERCLGPGCTDFAYFLSTSQPNGIDNPLGFGDYRYRVRATNAIGNSAYSNIVDLSFFAADAPSALSATTFSATQINLAWTDNGPYETGFEIQRCTGVGCSDFTVIDSIAADLEAFSDAGLTAGLSYTYRVRAYNVAGPSTFTNEASAATDLPAAPTAVSVTIDNPTDVTLNWQDNADNEDEYYLERCEGVGCTNFAFLAILGANIETYQDVGLTTGNTYRYRVQATNTAGASPFAAAATVELVAPDMPTAFVATVVNGTRVDLSWTDAADNELSYELERCTGTACVTFALLIAPAANAVSYSDVSAEVDSTYVYRLRAVNNVGASGYAASVEVNTIRPDQPSNFAASTFSATQIDLSWTDNSNNETGFVLERCTGVGCSVFDTLLVLGTDKDQYQDQSVVAEESYTYRLTAVNVAGDRGAVGPETATTFVPALPTDLTGVAVSSSQVNLSWTDAATNELGYRIERCSGNGCVNFVEIATTGADVSTFQSTGLVVSTIYRFRLRAFNAAGTSAYTSPVLSVATAVPGNPSALTALTVTASQVNLQFNDNSTSETGFTVQRCLGAACSDWADLATLPGSAPASAVGPVTYSDASLAFGQFARYRVRSFNGVGNSVAFTNIAEASTQVPNAPTSASGTAQGQTQTFFQWADNASNEGGVVVERCTGENCTDFAPIDTAGPDITSIVDPTVTGGNWYRYRARAIGNGSTSFGSSDYSNTVDILTIIPEAPTALSAVAISDNQVVLTWTDNSTLEDDHRIFRCSGADCVPNAQIGTTAGGNITTFTDITALPNELYRYAVSATNPAGESGLTNVAQAETNVPGLPTSFTATTLAATVVQLTWTDNATTETGFEIERCEGASCTDFAVIHTTAADVVTYDDSTALAGTVYRYRVRAITASTVSGYTGPSAASTTAPATPGTPSVVPMTTNLQVSWGDDSDDETGFELESCLGTGCSDFTTLTTLPSNTTSYQFAWVVDTLYRFRVRAVNIAGASAYSDITDRSTYRPSAPSALVATTATAAAIDLTWTDNANNEDEILVFRCDGVGCTPTVQVLSLGADAVSVRDEPLTPGLEYTYHVLARNHFGDSPLSATASASTDFPVAPASLLATTISDTQIDLAWDDLSTNETEFQIFRCEGASCTPVQIATVGTDVSTYSDVSVVLGNVYTYAVRASNGAGASPFTSEVEANTQLPADPTIVSATAIAPTDTRITWTPQANTQQYVIERCEVSTCGGVYTTVTTLAHPTDQFDDLGLSTGETYVYRVRGLNAAGLSIEGTAVPVALTLPAAPTDLAALALSSTQVQLTWVDVAGDETAYRIDRCGGGGCSDFVQIDQLAPNSQAYIDATVSLDERYNYRVVAVNAVGEALTQPVVFIQTSAPDAPTALTATTTAPGTIDLAWALNSTNELNVAIERCSGAGCTNFVQVQLLGAGVTTFQDTGLPNNVVWRYQVRAINNVGPSGYSNIEQANTIVPSQVGGLITTIVSGQRIDLNWTDGPLEQRYIIERCAGAGCSGFTVLDSMPANASSYVDNGLAYGTSYSYRIYGRNIAGDGPASVAATAVTTLNAPVNVQTIVLNRNDVQVDWSYAPNMTNYQFQVLNCAGVGCTPANLVTTLPSGTLTFTHAVPAGLNLVYAVRAVTVGGSSTAIEARPTRTPSELSNATAVTAIDDAAAGERHYVFNVPADALAMRVRMDSPSGDADLYVKFGQTPRTGINLNDAQNCVPYTGATPEVCNFTAPAAGDWFMMMQGFSPYTNASLKVSLAERFGWTGPLVFSASDTWNLVVAQQVTLTEPVSVTHFGARLQSVGGNIRFALYSSRDAGGVNEPNVLLLQGEAAYPAAGTVEPAVTETLIPAGIYWVAVNTSASGVFDSQGGSIPVRYYARDYALGWEAVWPLLGTNITTYQPFNFWIRGFR